MTPAQTEALLRLIGSHKGSASIQALLLVLDGMAPADAARATGITPQSVQRVVTRARAAMADVRALAGAELPF